MSDSLKEKLVTANSILEEEGILRGFGHVSVREPGSDELYISRAVSPGLVTVEDIMTISLDGRIVENETAQPYKETVIHRAIYRHRDDVNAVVHHHAHEIMPFAITDTELRPAFKDATPFRGGVPTFSDYDDEYGKLIVGEEEGDRMASALGDKRAQLLEAHGANVVGSTIERAVVLTITLVTNARYQQQAEQLGDPTYDLGSEEALESYMTNVFEQPSSSQRMWDYLASKVDR